MTSMDLRLLIEILLALPILRTKKHLRLGSGSLSSAFDEEAIRIGAALVIVPGDNFLRPKIGKCEGSTVQYSLQGSPVLPQPTPYCLLGDESSGPHPPRRVA